MELNASYDELTSYIKERFGQAVTFSCPEDGLLRVTYTKWILIKDVNISIAIRFEEVNPDSVLLAYDGALGLDMIISGALSFLTAHYPELSAGLHPQDNHRILINLAEIEKARPAVENIALTDIIPAIDSIKIEFALKTP